MIFATWILYFAALYLVYYLRVFCAGFGIYWDILPTALIHGVVFFGISRLLKLAKRLITREKRTLRKQENNPTTIVGVVTVGFSTMYALNSYGILTRAMSGYLIPMCVYIVLAVSLNLVVGISGELSLGHAGFMGVGTFAGIIAASCFRDMIANDFLLLVVAMFVGGLVAGIAGVIVGVPVLRLRGDYLAIVTLAFGEILKNIVGNLYVGRDERGLHFAMNEADIHLGEQGKMIIKGALGATGVQRISTFLAGFLLIAFTLFVVLNLVNSKEGRAIKAVRDNRIAAESVGINVTAFRLKAFVVSAFLAGMAGALYGLSLASVQASKFGYTTSIDILVYVVLGGMGNILGSIISTVVLYLIPEFLRALADYRMIMYAIVLIVVMLFTWSPKFKNLVDIVKSAMSGWLEKLLAKFKKKEVGAGE